MKRPAIVKYLPVSLLACLAVVMVVITSVSPTAAERDSAVATGFAMPPAPPWEPKALMPIRHPGSPAAPGPGQAVALRQLVIAVDEKDPGLAFWTSLLNQAGTPFDVLYARTDPFDATTLVRADGVGKYQSILLTDGGLVASDDGDQPVSAFDTAKWEILWDYERKFGVRQVAPATRPSRVPEDYCLRPVSEQEVADEPVPVTLTRAGAGIFTHLRPDAKLPVTNSYLYRSSVEPGCAAEPLLTAGGDVLAVSSTSPDGRERLALTVDAYFEEPIVNLLSHGLLRWATGGVFVGEKRHWLNVDMDDWFNSTLRVYPDGAEGALRLTGADALGFKAEQDALRADFPLVGDLKLNLPYNAGLFATDAPATCDLKAATPDDLSSVSKCLVDEFRWLNHTFSHPALNTTSYKENYVEIAQNLTAAADGGLPVPPAILKTPEYSGLGVYRDRPDDEDAKDHGLHASNKELLRAAGDLGLKYVHGDMSHKSHQPGCFNCGIHHPLQPDIMIVPDWPTDIAFEATTPEEQTALYNQSYGLNGTDPDHADRDFTYEEIVERESEIALRHMMSGSAYAFTLHQGNAHQYAKHRSLTFDWLRSLVAKYSAYYSVPLNNPDWSALADYVRARTSHWDLVREGPDPVWNRVTGDITYVPSGNGDLYLTGLETRPADLMDQIESDMAQLYGRDTVSRVSVKDEAAVTLRAVQHR